MMKINNVKIISVLLFVGICMFFSNSFAEDLQYVSEKSYVPRDVEVTYDIESTGALKEVGESSDAMYLDQITFKVLNRQLDESQKTTGDSRWKYVSQKVFKGRMPPVQAGIEEALVSEGNFVLIEFSVENDSALPVVVPPPLLIDQRGQRYLPLDNYKVEPYLPEGVFKTEDDIVLPSFKKKFCSVYEVSTQRVVSALEIFPVKAQACLVRKFKLTGKRLNFKALPPPPPNPKSHMPDFKVRITTFSRLRQGGGQTPGYYYDSSKKRSLAYGIGLRTTSKRTETLVVKAFFIGLMSTGKYVVADQKEASVEIASGRIEHLALQSDEISQHRRYYYNSELNRTTATLKGVIMQVWWGDKVLKGKASLDHLRKYEMSPNIPKEMGELRSESEVRNH